MTKEDVLDGYESTRVQMGYEHDDKVDMWERGCVEQAMDDWGKIQSLAFFKWNATKASEYLDYLRRVDKAEGVSEKELELNRFENSSLEARYELFLLSQSS